MTRLLVLSLLFPLLVGPNLVGADEEKKKSDPEAIALLDKAIAHQAPKEFAGADAIKDLMVRISAELWDYRKEPPVMSAIQVSRYLTLEPERFRSEWRPTGRRMVQGFDGRRYWYAEYDHVGAKTDARLLLGDAYKDDRKRIRDEMDETRHLLRFFFLTNLKGDHVVFTKAADETIDAFGSRACHVLNRVNTEEGSAERPLTLWIEKKTLNLVRATAHAIPTDRRSLQFTFKYDTSGVIQPRVKGVLFPYKMELHEKIRDAKGFRIVSRATLLENGIAFNSGLKATLFAPPKPPKKEEDE
jgi:hypothetical protein